MALFTTLVKRFVAPALPQPTPTYDVAYFDKLTGVLRLYFNQLDALLGQIVTGTTGTSSNPTYVAFADGAVDAFGRLRIGAPYTLFDSQQRYASDAAYDYVTATGGTTAFQTNKSATLLSVTTSSGSSAVAQTYRSFPYQPGKSLLTLQTFSMASARANLVQQVGLFNTQNGVFFRQQSDGLYMVIRSYTSGAVVETAVAQANWNGDTLLGTGNSGLTLDVTKTQIFYADLEWLGVGSVRVGFVINGQYINCHTFYNANVQSYVYMTTATLPLRYEIYTSGATSGAASLQMICSTVISEGGYEQVSQPYWVRQTTTLTTSTSFLPLCSIRLNSSRLGAVVLPSQFSAFPITNGNYEVVLVKHLATNLTGASWVTGTFPDVDYDLSATALVSQPTATQIIQVGFIASSNQSTNPSAELLKYQWDQQLGVSQAGVSDVLTLCIRSLTGSGSAVGALAFYDLSI